MKLEPHERDALIAWMKDENLSRHDVAKMFNVTYDCVKKWLDGGGLHAPQLARLRPLVSPYVKMELETQPDIELAALRSKLNRHVDTHPDLVQMHLAILDQLEAFLLRQQK